MSTNKGRSRKKASAKKEGIKDWSEENPDSEEEEVVQEVKTATPTVMKSVADFDRKVVETYEVKLVSELDIIELIKVLIVRGDESHNPALASGAEKLLRQLHREVLRTGNPRESQRSEYRHKGKNRGRGRGRGRFRGHFGNNNNNNFRGRGDWNQGPRQDGGWNQEGSPGGWGQNRRQGGRNQERRGRGRGRYDNNTRNVESARN